MDAKDLTPAWVRKRELRWAMTGFVKSVLASGFSALNNVCVFQEGGFK